MCNSYREPSNLFINKQTLFSQEGKTRGDPLAMSMYGIAIIPLIELLDDCFTVQKWYADDVNAVCSHDNMKKLFDSLIKHGPAFVYQLTKCHIITKKHLFGKAQQIFVHDEVEIVDGCRVLGGVISSENAKKKKFVERSLKQQK